jgi:hypothetical protein
MFITFLNHLDFETVLLVLLVQLNIDNLVF